jgi:hypothetical protein
MKKQRDGLQSFAEIMPAKLLKQITGPTAIEQRLIDASVFDLENPDFQRSILYQLTTFCQTCLPHRNPGDDVRVWERTNGNAALRLKAGEAMHPDTNKFVNIGLPFGPKCRLVLMHLNQIAKLKQSPIVEVGDSLTDFVRRVLNLDPKGRNINAVKDQLTRLASTDFVLGASRQTQDGSEAMTESVRIVKKFNVWFPKDASQRVLWPSVVQFSQDYFDALMEHAVPLDEVHVAALSHSSMALDIYAWLAQRLHRIPAGKPAFVSWAALYAQFGVTYTGETAIKNFRADFRTALKQVVTVYKDAKIEDVQHRPRRMRSPSPYGPPLWRSPFAEGITLRHSPPPVKYRALPK